MVPREAELVSEWTGLSVEEKYKALWAVQRTTALNKNIHLPFYIMLFLPNKYSYSCRFVSSRAEGRSVEQRPPRRLAPRQGSGHRAAGDGQVSGLRLLLAQSLGTPGEHRRPRCQPDPRVPGCRRRQRQRLRADGAGKQRGQDQVQGHHTALLQVRRRLVFRQILHATQNRHSLHSFLNFIFLETYILPVSRNV